MKHIADEWHIQQNIASDALEFWALNRTGDFREYVTAEFSIHRIDKHEFFDRGPTMRLASDECQQLMNELWRCGYRPRNGAGSLAHVDAQKAHLDDLRRIVFKDFP